MLNVPMMAQVHNPDPSPVKQRGITIVLWLGIILTSALALHGTRPPRALPAAAASDLFSATRAMTHLEHIALRPHPIGSDEAELVREYLVRKLSELGGTVRVEQGIGTAQYGRNISSGVVNNVVATFPGQSSARGTMLAAHYDSVGEGPGAADDGAGLVVILETIRALRAGPLLKNDLVVLFSDGEEARGLLGAKAFAASHPDLAARIGMMVNLEARGNSGPALMFETSNDNGALIRGFARAAPYPMASSLMVSIYKVLPNDTDFTPLKAAGLTGLNFAFVENYQSYHTRLDTIERLDARSVQQMGANVLGVVRHFGNLEQSPAKEPDLIYFNWFGSALILYPVWLAWIIALFAPVLLVVGCARSASQMRLTFGRIAAGFASFFLQLVIIVIGSFVAFAAARLTAGDFLEGDTASNKLLFVGVSGIGFGLAIASHRVLRNRLGQANLAAGQFFALSLLTIVVCGLLPGGSYVFEWPLVFAMAGMFLGVRLGEPARLICQFVFLIPALLVLVPLAYLFFVGLNFNYSALAATALLLTTLLATGLPVFDRLAGCSRFAVVILFLVSASLIGTGIYLSRWSGAHPLSDTLIYSVNADDNKAKWVSYDDAPDSWTARLLGPGRKQPDPAYTAGLERPVLSSDATLVRLTPPSVTVAQDKTSDGMRTLTLQVRSSRGARSLLVRLAGELKLTSAGWNGQAAPIQEPSRSSGAWSVRFYNLPPEGASLELRFAAQTPVRFWIGDLTPGLPPIEPLSARPDDTMAGYGSDVTLVTRMYEL